MLVEYDVRIILLRANYVEDGGYFLFFPYDCSYDTYSDQTITLRVDICAEIFFFNAEAKFHDDTPSGLRRLFGRQFELSHRCH